MKHKKDTQTKPGFAKLMHLQDVVEKIITRYPSASESLQSTFWDIYHHGEEVGIIRSRLEIATAMRKLGFSRIVISKLTHLPESDLAMWEEAQQETSEE